MGRIITLITAGTRRDLSKILDAYPRDGLVLMVGAHD